MGNLIKVSDVGFGGRRYTGTIVYSNVDDVIKRYRGLISDAVLTAAKTLTEGFRDEIHNTYSFKDFTLVDKYVTMRFNQVHNLANVRVISKQFSAGRMNFIAPAPRHPGYTTVDYMMKNRTKFKGFPIMFKHGGIMATRSGTKPLERWQHKQSAMPFTYSRDFEEIMDISKETIFETDVVIDPRTGYYYAPKAGDKDVHKRKHSFRIVKTKNIVKIAERAIPRLVAQISNDVNLEITRPKTQYWKFKKKKRRG